MCVYILFFSGSLGLFVCIYIYMWIHMDAHLNPIDPIIEAARLMHLVPEGTERGSAKNIEQYGDYCNVQ